MNSKPIKGRIKNIGSVTGVISVFPESGFELNIDSSVEDKVYVAGAKLVDGILKTAGGRVLGVTDTADTLEEALKKAYDNVKLVKFENAFYRNDIGAKALKCNRI